ncbi:putative quinol monooxygenase [Benzoatithermus flavus]|uniref:Quinol monooxygenase n=1 Tax=Benzoatithermus flavus TaxID=3108223 RepID=A0ABU8XW28_9PROT
MDRRHVILVEFTLAPATRDAFRALVLENAAASMQREPGCRRFDVLVPEGDPGDRVILYEIYDDAAAFEAHLASEHYRRFAEAAGPLVLTKAVTRLGFAA